MTGRGTDIYVSKSTGQIDVLSRIDKKYSRLSKSSTINEIGRTVYSGIYAEPNGNVVWELPKNYNSIKADDWKYGVVVLEVNDEIIVTTPYWDYERAPKIQIKDTSNFDEIGQAVIETFNFCERVLGEDYGF